MTDNEAAAGAAVLSPEVQRLLNQVVLQNQSLAKTTLKQKEILRKASIKAEVTKHKVLSSFIFYFQGF